MKNFFLVCSMALSGIASAQSVDTYPSRPVRIIVHSAPGGLLDATTRIVASKLADQLGQQVVIDNRAGAGGLVGIRAAKASPADGYTLLATVNTVTIQQALNQEPGYDLAKDFVAISPFTRSPFLLVAGVDHPGRNLQDLLSYVRANPGKVTYGSGGIGSTTHLAAAYLAQRAGLDMTHVPYKGNSAVWPDLLSGRVGLLIEGYSTAMPMVKDGRMKIYGVTGSKRVDALPGTPSIAEAGVPDFNYYLWVGLLAPTGTPKGIVEKLSAAVRLVMSSPEIRERFRVDGAEPLLMSPGEFDRFLRDEAATTARLVNALALPKD